MKVMETVVFSGRYLDQVRAGEREMLSSQLMTESFILIYQKESSKLLINLLDVTMKL